MNKITYCIEGLDCPHCALGLANYLSDCEGIKKADINLLNKSLIVEYENEAMKVEELLALALKGTDDPINIFLPKVDDEKKVKIIDKEIIINLIRIIVTSAILLVSLFVVLPLSKAQFDTYWILNLVLILAAYVLISYDYLWKFIKAFRHPTKIFNETVLMVTASIGALAIQEFPEAVLVMILGQVGEIFEHVSVNKSKNSIIDTIDNRPKIATKLIDGQYEDVLAKELNIGDIILIRTGEIIPCDGKVCGGNGYLDTSSVTGEFKPVHLAKDQIVMSGTALTDGTIQVEVTKKFSDSTTSKILDMVMESGEHKSKAEAFINKFATWYTPMMFVFAFIIGLIVPLIVGGVNGYTWEMWRGYIYTALTFLVISCPCAIVISVPLAYFVGTTLAFKKGIIVKGSNYLDRLNDLSMLVTDKTGTITTGKFEIQKIEINEKYKDVFKEYVCALEAQSNHPIAKAILNEINVDFSGSDVKNIHEMPRYGIQGEYKNHKILIGNISLMNKENIVIDNEIIDATYVAIDANYAGYIIIDDTIKEGTQKAINYLSKQGIQTLMLTGGDEKAASKVARAVGISAFEANLLPEDKINYLKAELKNKKAKSSVAYIGDGLNDAPSIILSDVGIAMGGIGADAAVENADIVLTNDDPVKLIEMLKIARATRNRAIFNIVFALTLKVVVMILSLFKLIPMWGAVICDTGLSVFLIIVSILLIKKKIKID